jgi:hypothetical protein
VSEMHTTAQTGKSTPARMPSVLTHRQCDKKGRADDDDPCSECRHFGGPDCNCRLAESMSYNDQVFEHKMAPTLEQPIDDAHVKSDWRGKTKEQLLQKHEYLPAFVRQPPSLGDDDDDVIALNRLPDNPGELEERSEYESSDDEMGGENP